MSCYAPVTWSETLMPPTPKLSGYVDDIGYVDRKYCVGMTYCLGFLSGIGYDPSKVTITYNSDEPQVAFVYTEDNANMLFECIHEKTAHNPVIVLRH